MKSWTKQRSIRVYPPLHGTSFRAGEVTYLYTTGYLPTAGGSRQGHVPSPLELIDHIGDTPHSKLMREICRPNENELKLGTNVWSETDYAPILRFGGRHSARIFIQLCRAESQI